MKSLHLRSHRVVHLALLTLACLPPVVARAAWPLEGLPLSDGVYGYSGNGQPQFAYLSAGPSGSIFAAAGNAAGMAQFWRVQRVLAVGGIAPMWTSSGIPSGGAGLNSGVGFHGFTVDEATTWWHAWRESDSLRLQAVHPDGTTNPSDLYSGGVGVGYMPHSPVNPRLASDGVDGVYLATYGNNTGRIRVQHLLADFSTALGWNPRGRLIGSTWTGEFCHLQPDGEGGVVVVWPEVQVGGNQMRAVRLNADTTVAAGWTESGIALGAQAIWPSSGSRPPFDMLVRSSSDHFIAGWTSEPSAGDVHVHLQRFGLDGTLDPDWPAASLEAVTPGDNRCVTLVPDGLGGVHVLWEASGVPRTTHVSAAGQYVPGHDANGAPLVDAGAVYRPQTTANWGNHAVDHLAGATGPAGGLVFAWPDFRWGMAQVRVRWLLANGSPDPAEDASGRVVSPPDVGNVMAALSDGVGGAYVAWWEYVEVDLQTFLENRITRAARGGSLGVEPRPGYASGALTLRPPFPNPAHGDVRFQVGLPGDDPARLVLLDVSGRVVRTAEVAGAGEHTIRFEQLDALAPGLYFARLAQGRFGRAERLVISR